MVLSLLIVLVFFSQKALAQQVDICSRVAVINHQEVLVDVNNDQKGEGLRHYLEKDAVARHYLDLYQEGTRIKWQNTLLGPLSAGLVVSGLTVSSDKTKKSLIVSGGVLMLVNFLMSATMRENNEENLRRAVREYNQRHTPRIEFYPPEETPLRPSSSPSFSFVLAKNWRF